MKYYLLPKHNLKIKISICHKIEQIPVLSQSLHFYLNNIYNQIGMDNNNADKIDHIFKLVNPFEFLSTNVIDYGFPVSKKEYKTNTYFEVMELFKFAKIIDALYLTKKINVCIMSPNHNSLKELLQIKRCDNNDVILFTDFEYDNIIDTFIANKFEYNIDLFIFEFKKADYANSSTYQTNLILVLILIIKFQSFQGISIIKIDDSTHQLIIDIIYILSCHFEKTFLVKPLTSNIINGEKYIICNGFDMDKVTKKYIVDTLEQLINSSTISIKNIYSLIDNEIPYHFIKKIEESNIVFGQQQLEIFDQIINILNNNNNHEKLESLKNAHIQKCIQWCDKNKITSNKFMDKMNIFLKSKKNA